MLGRMLRRTAGVLGGVLLACDGSRECLTPAAADSGAPSGAVVWQEAFTATESDIGKAIAVDACDGRVAVGGSVRPRVVNGDADLWIGALSHAGEPLWDTRIHERFDEAAGAVRFDADGALLVAGVSQVGSYDGSDIDAGWLARFEAPGGESWRVRLEETAEERDVSYRFAAVAVAPDGRIFVAGARVRLYDSSALAAGYDFAGELLWTAVLEDDSSSSELTAVAVLPGGEVLFVGNHYVPATDASSLLQRRFSADGGLLDERLVAGTGPVNAAEFTPSSLVVADRGRVVELGFDGRVLREAGLVEGPNDLALGLGGDVYLVGDRNLGGSEWFPCVTRLDRDFARVWEYVHARPGLARSVAVGPSGDAFVTGRVEAPPVDGASELPNYDVWIARFAR